MKLNEPEDHHEPSVADEWEARELEIMDPEDCVNKTMKVLDSEQATTDFFHVLHGMSMLAEYELKCENCSDACAHAGHVLSVLHQNVKHGFVKAKKRRKKK